MARLVALDVADIIRQIEAEPGTRAQLRAVLLGDQFVELPVQMAELTARFSVVETDVAELKGDSLERQVHDRPGRYIYDHAERIRVVSDGDLDDLIGTLEHSSPLSGSERRRLRRTDLVAEARRPGPSERVTVVAEVSHAPHEDDILRAAHSAEILSSRSRRAIALAIGEDLGGAAVADVAAAHHVILVDAYGD